MCHWFDSSSCHLEKRRVSENLALLFSYPPFPFAFVSLVRQARLLNAASSDPRLASSALPPSGSRWRIHRETVLQMAVRPFYAFERPNIPRSGRLCRIRFQVSIPLSTNLARILAASPDSNRKVNRDFLVFSKEILQLRLDEVDIKLIYLQLGSQAGWPVKGMRCRTDGENKTVGDLYKHV